MRYPPLKTAGDRHIIIIITIMSEEFIKIFGNINNYYKLGAWIIFYIPQCKWVLIKNVVLLNITYKMIYHTCLM